MPKTKEELIGRAVIDADFRKRLLTDPEATMKAEGYAADADFVERIKSVDPDAAEEAAASFSGEAARKAGG